MVLTACATLAGGLSAQTPSRQELESEAVRSMRRIGSMSQLMVHLIYPTSDAIFYILTRTPTSTAEWNALEGQALMLAESANLLMMPSRARDSDQWIRDARLLLDAGNAAFRAAQDRDVEALSELNEQLYQSCITCHQHYRRGYPTPR